MYLELVVDDDAACRGGVELLDDGQMCGMLHVLLKTSGVLEPGEYGVGVFSGTPREILSHGEVYGARDFFAQAADRRDEILDLFLRGPSRTAKNTRWSTIALSSVPNIPYGV